MCVYTLLLYIMMARTFIPSIGFTRVGLKQIVPCSKLKCLQHGVRCGGKQAGRDGGRDRETMMINR